MIFSQKLFLLASIITLSGCASNDIYRQSSAFGYSNQAGPGKLTTVSVRIVADRKIAEGYLLYRCAELAQKAGHPYFVLYKNVPSAVHNVPIIEPISELIDTVAFGLAKQLTVYAYFIDEQRIGTYSVADTLSKYEKSLRRQAQ